MQINDNLPVTPKPVQGFGSTDSAQKTTTPSPDVKVNTPAATPAASIDVAVTAQLSQASSKKDINSLPDKVLLDKIKAKIANGTFEIDYQQISQAILQDSLSQIGARPGN
jgi:anti-sigma28 factor (negative regulator of flagellin synthesis)